MTKVEFSDFIDYVRDVLGPKILPDNPNSINLWFEAFKNTHINIAKQMIDLYMKNEEGYFKLAVLLKYKQQAMQGSTYYEKTEEKGKSKLCKLCNNTGFVQIQDRGEFCVPLCVRCICSSGERLNNKIEQITERELDNSRNNGFGMIVRNQEG